MNDVIAKERVNTEVRTIERFINSDLSDLCDATEATINDDAFSFSIGIKQSDLLDRDKLESYWNGVLLVPERVLIIGKLDGVIASSIQLVLPVPSNKTSAFCGHIENHFVAPWARGYGLARMLLKAAENEAKKNGLSVLRLSVRSSLDSAIKLYEANSYVKWGILDKYEKVDDQIVAGYFYYKDLQY